MESTTSKRTPRDLLRIVFRRRWVFLFTASVVAVAVLAIAPSYFKLKYTGTAVIEWQKDPIKDSSGKSETRALGSMRLDMIGNGAIEAMIDSLLSADTLHDRPSGRTSSAPSADVSGGADELDQVKERLTKGLDRNEKYQLTDRAKQDLVSAIKSKLKMDYQLSDSLQEVVAVSYTDADPLLAKWVPNLIAKNYIQRTRSRIEGTLRGERIQETDHIEKIKRVIDASVKERTEFLADKATFMPDNPSALPELITKTDADLARQKDAMEEAERRLIAYKHATSTMATSRPVETVFGPNPEYLRLTQQLQVCRETLDQQLTVNKMTEKHPEVMKVRAKIASIERALENTPKDTALSQKEIYEAAGDPAAKILGAERAMAQADFDRAQSEVKRLSKYREELKTNTSQFTECRNQYLEKDRQITEKQKELDFFQARLRGTEIALVAVQNTDPNFPDGTSLRAREWARDQYLPSDPKLSMILAIAVAAGLGLGGAVVFLAGLMDRTISTVEEASEMFQLPAHGVIDEIVTPAQRAKRRFRRVVLGPAAASVLLMALFLTSMNLFFWLERPMEYREWQSHPVEHVWNKAKTVMK